MARGSENIDDSFLMSPFIGRLTHVRKLRRHVRLLSVINQDWVHGILSDGIMGREMALFIAADTEMTMRDWEALLKSDVRFPRSYATKGSYL